MLDVNSLLIATAISGVCLSFTVISFWRINRGSGFMVTWAAAIVVLVGHIAAFWFYDQTRSVVLGTLASALLPVGAAILYAASRQFVFNERPVPVALWISVACLVVVPPVFALGYDGLALVLQNAVTAAMFFLTAATYYGARRDAPFSLVSLSVLYCLIGVSFMLCSTVLLLEGQWRIGYPPANWAEDVNVVMSVLGITGIGALTLLLDQSRLAKQFQRAATIDPMTGLLNRRALYAEYPESLGPGIAVVIFDIDHFKQINDRYGHGVGDEVIMGFARAFRETARDGDMGFRLGGEEFAMVVSGVTPGQARSIAERVSAGFAGIEFESAGASFKCTISAGIAFGHDARPTVDEVIARADRALYSAKSAGRNRVEIEELRLAG